MSCISLSFLSPSSLSFTCFISEYKSFLIIHSQAAQSWVSLSNVSDKHSQEGSSELSKYCTILRTFSDEGREGIISLCTITSKNFGGGSPGVNALTVRGSSRIPLGNHHHYHSGYALSGEEILEGKNACFSCLISQIAAVAREGELRVDGSMEDEVRWLASVCVCVRVCVCVCVCV